MNKQELIKKIDNMQYSLSWNIPRINKEIVLDLVEQLDEPQKVTVPQYVADWIEACSKNYLGFNLKSAMNVNTIMHYSEDHQKLLDWIKVDTNQDIFARAWLDGYEVEKEKRYLVKMKDLETGFNFLNRHKRENYWVFSSKDESITYQVHHTRKELEDGGLGEALNSPLFEVEEVE